MTKTPKQPMPQAIKDQINAALRHFIFELNDEQTRAKVRNAVKAILATHYTQRGEFFVNCDAKNNTEEVLQAHALVVEVGVRGDKLYKFVLSPKPVDPVWVR